MAKSAKEHEEAFLSAIDQDTGHTLEEWMSLIDASGETKTNGIIKWIKAEQGLNHMQANMLASIYLNGGQPVYDYEVMFNKLFAGKEEQEVLYQALSKLVAENFKGVDIHPTKTYVAFDAPKLFATAKINKKNIRVGLDLGDAPFAGRLEKGKSLGAMPRISHMVEIVAIADVDDELLGYLHQAQARVNG